MFTGLTLILVVAVDDDEVTGEDAGSNGSDGL